jgi:phosphatidylglycerophosphatase A
MNQVKLAQRVWQNPAYFIAFGFGSGLMPIAPGTWGTLAAIPIYYLMRDLPWPLYVILTLAAFILGVWVSERVSKDLGVHDYKGIVWDEVVGYLLTMFLAPNGLFWIISGFILFRIFDIWKPQPIGWIDQKVSGGLGIMLDDVVAAVPACLILQIFAWSLAK